MGMIPSRPVAPHGRTVRSPENQELNLRRDEEIEQDDAGEAGGAVCIFHYRSSGHSGDSDIWRCGMYLATLTETECGTMSRNLLVLPMAMNTMDHLGLMQRIVRHFVDTRDSQEGQDE